MYTKTRTQFSEIEDRTVSTAVSLNYSFKWILRDFLFNQPKVVFRQLHEHFVRFMLLELLKIAFNSLSMTMAFLFFIKFITELDSKYVTMMIRWLISSLDIESFHGP